MADPITFADFKRDPEAWTERQSGYVDEQLYGFTEGMETGDYQEVVAASRNLEAWAEQARAEMIRLWVERHESTMKDGNDE